METACPQAVSKSPRVYHIRLKIEPRYGHCSPSLINPARSAFYST